jgi:radical SAM superfamily enzyme YgiQ (UPF0313 family)
MSSDSTELRPLVVLITSAQIGSSKALPTGQEPKPLSRENAILPLASPIGLLNIASVLLSQGFEVMLFNLLVEADPAGWIFPQLLAINRQPLAVGFTVYTETARMAGRIGRIVRQVFPDTKIIFGGAHPTPCYDECMANPDVDFVVRGEGEATIVELLEAIRHPAYPLENIKGLVFRQPDGTLRRNPDRAPIRVLDQLPIPAYHLLYDGQRAHSLALISSRGCPGRCLFCASRAISGPLYRAHSAEWMISVVYSQHLRFPFRTLSIQDDSFTTNRTRVKKFCAFMCRWPERMPWTAKSRADVLREDLIEMLAEAGCNLLHVGAESADDGVLSQINKGIKVTQLREAVRLAVKHRIPIVLSFIVGHPSDTIETMEKTVIFGLALREIAGSAIAISTPFPGTPLYERAEELGIQIQVADWQAYNLATPIYSTRNFTVNDLWRVHLLSKESEPNWKLQFLPPNGKHAEFLQDVCHWVGEMKQLMGPPAEASPVAAVEESPVPVAALLSDADG